MFQRRAAATPGGPAVVPGTRKSLATIGRYARDQGRRPLSPNNQKITRATFETMLPFNRTDLERLFPSTIWKKAEDLVAHGAVLEVEVERDGRSVTGRIKGERRAPFLTRVKIANGRGGRVKITSTCTCLVYSECEHAAATLLGVLDKTAAPSPDDVVGSIDQEVEAWIGAVNAAARQPATNGHAEGSECILYLLEPAQRAWRDQGMAQPIMVVTMRARPLAGRAARAEPLAAYATGRDRQPGRRGSALFRRPRGPDHRSTAGWRPEQHPKARCRGRRRDPAAHPRDRPLPLA